MIYDNKYINTKILLEKGGNTDYNNNDLKI